MNDLSLTWANIYWLLPLSASAVGIFIVAYLFGHHSRLGAKPLMLTMAAASWWGFAYAMEIRSISFESKIWWVKLEYIGGGWMGLFCLLFVLVVTGKNRWMTTGRLLILSIIPVAGPTLAFTNEFHGLMWKAAWLDTDYSTPAMAYERGIGFWIYAGYSYVLLLIGTVVLIQFYRRSVGIYRKRLRIILLGIMIPWVSNALYLGGQSPIAALDLTPFAFTISGVIFFIGIFRFRLLDIVPIAREALLEAIGDAVLVLDTQDHIVHVNSQATNLLKNEDFESARKQDVESLPVIFGAIGKLRADRRKQTEIQLWVNGIEKSFNLLLSPLFSRKNRQVGWLLRLRDITESKRAEEALRNSEEKFRSITDNALDGIVMINPLGKISLWNHAAESIFGYSENEALGEELHMLLSPRRYHHDYFERFSKFIRTGKGPVVGKTVELSALKKDGTEFPIELSISNLFLKGQWHAVGIVRDITKRKKYETEKADLQANLQRARKMEAIGTLAGGVAHDLNNILSGIVSYPDLLLTQIPENSPLRTPLQTIRESGNKAAAIVQDLLTLARRNVPTYEIVCLNSVVSEYLDSPEYGQLKQAHPQVRVSTSLFEKLPAIQGSKLHLSKTLMNLVINAFEAMPDGGRLSISTGAAHIDRPTWGAEEMEAGDYVTMTVSDEGLGIPEKDRERIFEPFYTKKHMGKSGTGLGMAVVWGTVKDHNGSIRLDSTEGVGATFTLYFPAAPAGLKELPASEPDLEECRGKGETVLVVDDVPEQRIIASEMLKQLGYVVETAESGEATLTFLANGEADLVILDMIMAPGMDGLDTYLEIKKHTPEQKVLIASGFSETGRVRAAQKNGAGAYIKKPYSMKNLAVMVRKELETGFNDLPEPVGSKPEG